MAEAQTLGDLTLPPTEPYRVVGVGATYFEPVATVGGDGKPTVVLSYRVGGRGERSSSRPIRRSGSRTSAR
jgi:hypothetical protein